MSKKEIKKVSKEDDTLEALLDLNGETFVYDDKGHYTKFRVWEIEPTPERPHGIRYSLTLHNRHNHRILGFDNAHAVQPKKKKYGGRKIITWDHKHYHMWAFPYEYESAGQLITDFWNEVRRILGE